MIDEKALDAACEAWKMEGELLFTRRDKVRCVVEAYLDALPNKHSYNPEMVEKIKSAAKENPVASFYNIEEAHKWLDGIATQNSEEISVISTSESSQ